MKKTPLEKKIFDLATPLADDMGLAIVQVKASGADGGQTVQIMAENPQTRRLGIDDCAALSRAISAAMDVEDLISGAYKLEVSSPGIDRPLTRLQDFVDYEGFEAKLETSIPNEAGQKRFRGFLKGLKDENILINTDQGEAEVPFHGLSKAKLVLTDDLIKRTANI